ncbi:hypothetical protein GCM10027568_22330 [Humibacter soli]
MKAELVNLVTTGGTETAVLLTTELDELTPTEHVRALELTIWLVDEGWTVTTTTGSPLASVVRKGAEAMHGTYHAIPDLTLTRIQRSRHHLPPRLGIRLMAP